MNLPINVLYKDLHFSLESIERNKVLNCKSINCYQFGTHCQHIKASNIDTDNNKLIYTKIIFTITNSYNKERRFDYDNFTLIDTNLFSYKSFKCCLEMENSSRLQYDYFCIPPQSKARIAVFFPELEQGVKISKILFKFCFYDHNSDTIAFDICNADQSQISNIYDMHEESLFNNLRKALEDLKKLTSQETHNVLDKWQKNNIRNSIQNMENKIKLKLSELNEQHQLFILSELSNVMSEYRSQIDLESKPPAERTALSGCREDLGTDEYRSSWEANIARILKSKGIKFEYEKKRYDLSHESYLPDFFISDDTIIEVKGFWNNESIVKVDEFARSKQVKNYLIVDYDMYYDIDCIYSKYKMLPHWEESTMSKGKTETVVIVGLQFVPDKTVLQSLQIGQSLNMEIEPNNPYDEYAIIIKTQSGGIVGHMNKQMAYIYNQKLSLGMTFSVTISEIKDKILKVKIKRNNFDTVIIHDILK